ncbi:MAG: helix-turn-helix transcriptional regulator, partial [Actinomycetota bacterium]
MVLHVGPVLERWRPLVEVNEIDPGFEGLGPDGLAYPLDRAARAAEGTPLPEGWELVEADEMAAAAPLGLTHGEALPLWQSARFGRTVFTTIIVMPQPGGWQVSVGIGGEARVLRGVFAERSQAVAAGDAEIMAQREPLSWAGPFPPVRILEAPTPGWEALRAAGQLSAPAVYGINEIAAACGVSIDAARKWQQRGQLPEPAARLSAGWIWTGAEIEQWLESRRPVGRTVTTEAAPRQRSGPDPQPPSSTPERRATMTPTRARLSTEALVALLVDRGDEGATLREVASYNPDTARHLFDYSDFDSDLDQSDVAYDLGARGIDAEVAHNAVHDLAGLARIGAVVELDRSLEDELHHVM